jgi:hypothetical protein
MTDISTGSPSLAGRPYRPAILFCAIFVIMTGCGCGARADGQIAHRIGGACEYKSYPGYATIISIEPAQNVAPGEEGRFDVRFSFKSRRKIKEDFAREAARFFYLFDNSFQCPDAHFLRRNSIREGAVLEGVMRVITSGTCTPVLFEFPALKSDE